MRRPLTDGGASEMDIVIWGATGFTGSLVCEHLAESYDPSELDWAIAGRNAEKLERRRAEIAGVDAAWESLPTLTGDARDRESLLEIARATDVVCTTVGPYSEYGTPLVEACVESGTDYCDLSGEVPWMRRTIDSYHEPAREGGARIVHSCGFDSIPSDLGTLVLQEAAHDTYGSYCTDVRAFARIRGGGVSGGTAASLVRMFEEASNDREARRVLADPYSLCPEGEREGVDDDVQRGPRHDDGVRQWTAPFIMAPINERNVRRTNALLGYPWGRDFRYGEAVPKGGGFRGATRAATSTAGTGLLTAAMSVGPLRRAVSRLALPDPGEGPDREVRESSSFEVRFVGEGGEEDSDEAFEVRATVAADRDPGYGATAWMLGEAAVCLARDEVESPHDGGVLTPASGIGLPLVDRLRDVGMTFEAEV